jgi:MFS family permease
LLASVLRLSVIIGCLSLNQFFNFPPTLSRQLKSNFIYLLWDIGWWGLYTGATFSFLAIYASRCGATPQQIGLITALPATLSLLISLPAGQWLRRFPARTVTVWGAFASRLLLITYVIMPWVLPIQYQIYGILALTLVIAIPSTLINISFDQFFMEAVPSEWRGPVVGTRNAISAIVSLLVTLLCGQILSLLAFPISYQVVFFIGFIGAIMTSYQIAHVHPLDELVVKVNLKDKPAAEVIQSKRKFFPVVDGQGKNYFRVIGLLFLFNLTNNAATPLIPDLLVHRLKLSDFWISIGISTSTLVVLIISLFIARITRRAGNRRATVLGAALLAVQAVVLALAQNSILYLVSTVAGGIATGILNAAQYNYHLDNVPDLNRSNWLSINLLLGNAAILLGALCGPLIANALGSPDALIIIGALRMAVGLAILKWGEPRQRNPQLRGALAHQFGSK